jgi:hypothetical protein
MNVQYILNNQVTRKRVLFKKYSYICVVFYVHRNMEKVLAAYNISTINKSVKHENRGEDDPNYQSPDDKNRNPALSMSRLKHNTLKSTNSTLIYDQPSTNYDGGNYSDGKSRNDGTLSYANSKFGTGETLFSRIKKNTVIQFSGVLVTRSLVLCVCFVDGCLSFCVFSFGHCIVCPSIYRF